MTNTALARPPSLSDQVTEALRERVVSGQLRVGDLLPSEASIARENGVSRTVVREAISRLKAQGLVRSEQGRGLFVASRHPSLGFSIPRIDPDRLAPLVAVLELRAGIEAEAAALAATRRSEDDLARIAAAAEDYRAAALREAVTEAAEADMAFHRAVHQATQNPHYLALFQYLGAHLLETVEAGRRLAIQEGRGYAGPHAEHVAILDALRAGDPEAARSAARSHVQATQLRLSGDALPAAGRPAPGRPAPGT
jgi:GntR family transcriptional repressor for pyruvate dehydrogenase complex